MDLESPSPADFTNTFGQADYSVRFDWGVQGLSAISARADVVVVVDVLSFSTAVDIATSRGATIFPARWNDDRATVLAESVGAVLAVPRKRMSAENPYSLSPASFASIARGARVVLPSPNGAAVVLAAEALGLKVIAGCLRNAAAVAQAAKSFGCHVSVVAAGEQWPNGTLRPAVEDLVGAGAIIDAMGGFLSPESHSAVGAFRAVNIAECLADSASGRELNQAGFSEDVRLAGLLNSSGAVPVLKQGAFG